jgi:hypothetical protein
MADPDAELPPDPEPQAYDDPSAYGQQDDPSAYGQEDA